MDKYKKYSGLIIFLAGLIVLFVIAYIFVKPMVNSVIEVKEKEESTVQLLASKKAQMQIIHGKIARMKDSVLSCQKKIYAPIESNLGDDTLFFTLYSDMIEMVHANKIKINSIDYQYNPSKDAFTKQGGKYFVCDVNLKLVSNYVNLGKLIQDIYQYPYYIKINSVEVLPYPKDKKILLTSMSLRLYAHTLPEETGEDKTQEEILKVAGQD